MDYKSCSKCGISKELNENNFHKRKGSKDGFRNECKTCKNKMSNKYYNSNKNVISEKSKDYYEKNKIKILEYAKEYQIKKADSIRERLQKNKKERNEISRNYYYKNHEDRKNKARAWKKNNPESVKKNKKDWYKTERGRSYLRLKNRKRKSKRAGNTLTLDEWNECVEYFKRKCAYCDKEDTKLEMEHFIPLSKGGVLSIDNVVPSCRNCNASKSNIDFFEWYPEYEFYSIERKNKILNYLKEKELEKVII